jgi:hypothetical protein
MVRCSRSLCIAVTALMLMPMPGALSGWIPLDITSPSTLSFPPKGGNNTTYLKVPADGLVKDDTFNITGSAIYTNDSWAANSTGIWGEALSKDNLTNSPDGIGLGGYGSWWEETGVEALGRMNSNNSSPKNWSTTQDGYLGLAKGLFRMPIRSHSIISMREMDGTLQTAVERVTMELLQMDPHGRMGSSARH